MLLANIKAGIAQKERALFSLGTKYNVNDDAKLSEKIERQNQYSAQKPIRKEINREEEKSVPVLQLKQTNLEKLAVSTVQY
jgi:hypothetical protein